MRVWTSWCTVHLCFAFWTESRCFSQHLCYSYDEKSSLGHLCKLKQLFLIEDDFDNEVKETIGEINEEAMEPKISMHDISGSLLFR